MSEYIYQKYNISPEYNMTDGRVLDELDTRSLNTLKRRLEKMINREKAGKLPGMGHTVSHLMGRYSERMNYINLILEERSKK